MPFSLFFFMGMDMPVSMPMSEVHSPSWFITISKNFIAVCVAYPSSRLPLPS